MRIGILTLPLWNNYGGIIQAYALQKTLSNLGHTIVLIDYHHNYSKYDILKSNFSRFIKAKILNLKNAPFYPNINENRFISINTLDFINLEFPNKTKKLTSTEDLKDETSNLDAIIVGSDQVWRPNYTPDISNYFLSFAKESQIKIAYAASFGTDKWLFNSDEEDVCKKLIGNFDAISVREESAVGLVKAKFDVDSVQLIVPTMLLRVEDYKALFSRFQTEKSKGRIFTYVLDQTPQIEEVVKKFEKSMGTEAFEIMPKKFDKDFSKAKSDYIFPPLYQWLKSFHDADFIIADSFHGCVFSIIFNKPFIAIGNKERGLTRFTSLLKLFDLQDRLLDLNSITTEILHKEIDWDSINEKLYNLRNEAFGFLKNSLHEERNS